MAAPTISCPGCGKSYSVDRPELIGKKAQCKQCRTRFVITEPKAGSGAGRPASGLIEVKSASKISAPAAKSGATLPMQSGVTLPMQSERRTPPAAEPAEPEKAGAEAAGKLPANPDEHYPDDLMTISFTEYEARKTRQALMEALQKQKKKPE
jgi:hypothetical protein